MAKVFTTFHLSQGQQPCLKIENPIEKQITEITYTKHFVFQKAIQFLK